MDAGEVTLRKLSSLLVFVSCVLADYTRTIHETTPNRTNKPLRVASWIVLHGKPISQNQEIKILVLSICLDTGTFAPYSL